MPYIYFYGIQQHNGPYGRKVAMHHNESYKVNNKLRNTSNVCLGAVSQKLVYSAVLLGDAPGESLMTLKLRNGTCLNSHTWAMAADSISTAST